MKDSWYKTAFGPHYTDLYSHRNADDARRAIDFITGQSAIGPDSGPILDLCCGAGRHSLELLGRRPANIIGLDLAPNLLELARDSAGHSHLPLHLIRGDMRRLPFADQSFGLVLNLFTSFGYFMHAAENEAVFAEISRVLKPENGQLIFDHINPPYLKANLQPETSRNSSRGAMVRECRTIDFANRRVEKTIDMQIDGLGQRFFESVRFYEKEEICEMALRAGLAIESAFGGFDASQLTPNSPRALYILKKIN